MATKTKKTASFTIEGRLNGLNEYILACRTNRFAGAKMKKKNKRPKNEQKMSNNLKNMERG